VYVEQHIRTIGATTIEIGAATECGVYQLEDAITDKTYCEGATGGPISFSTQTPGTASYSWTSTANVGFTTSGNTNIGTFTALNGTNGPVTATVSVTATIDGCTGLPTTFKVTVNPSPTVNTITNVVKCNGETISPISFTSPTTGGTATFHWTSDLDIGFGQAGTTFDGYTAQNNSNVTKVATISVKATINGCEGPATTFTIEGKVLSNPSGSKGKPSPLYK